LPKGRSILIAELKAHNKRQAADRLKAGSAWTDNDLVFCNALGEPFDPRAFVAHFERFLKTAELPKRCPSTP